MTIANVQTQGCTSTNQLAAKNDMNDDIDLSTNMDGSRSQQ